jgi:hypothetical protein
MRTTIGEELDDPDASWKILYHNVSRKSLYSDHAGSYFVCITPFDVYVGTLIVPSSKRCDGDVKPLCNLRCLLILHFVSCARGMSGEDENGLSP